MTTDHPALVFTELYISLLLPYVNKRVALGASFLGVLRRAQSKVGGYQGADTSTLFDIKVSDDM